MHDHPCTVLAPAPAGYRMTPSVALALVVEARAANEALSEVEKNLAEMGMRDPDVSVLRDALHPVKTRIDELASKLAALIRA